MKSYNIDLPEQVASEMGVTTGDQVELSLKNNNKEAQLKPKPDHVASQTLSLRFFLVPTILAGIAFLGYCLFMGIRTLPMTGTHSIASLAIDICEISGMLTFLFTYIWTRKKFVNLKQRKNFWRVLPTLFISFAIILGFVLSGLFWAIGYMFAGSTFDIYTATLIFLMFNAIVNFLMIYSALSISTTFIASLFFSTILGGVIVSIVTNSSRFWWKHNISFLGSSKALNAWQFNLTILIAALLWVALVDFLFVPIMEAHPRNWRLTTLRTLLTLAAISMAGVGIFPNNGGLLHFLHDQSSNFLIYFIIIMIVAIYWLLPNASHEFISTSYIIGGVLILSLFLFKYVRYLSLTAFEIIAFVLAMSWILLLLQTISRLYNDQNNVYLLDVDVPAE